ncbi:hypothetical protein Ssi03_50370 [Sphaerisporangium siamense]|uniref:Uncharacterized protein n=1 Tax=Sphaerisporangium siamense TaxID=795645 RepID=A0A7W7DBC8_9ACTN|nr:hypothetical protein [Sphaerisporangium siamense]MBB4702258.1 hypothetical protein [Sphaerisporangium siamense]GII87047.1 hypothetical protein Ssi03_50370 [Sphaerisporangium siamense]
MAVRYRYVFADLLTDQTIDDLPLSKVSFDHRINQPGTFAGGLPITNRRIARRLDRVIPADIDDLSAGPGRIVCHCLRDNGTRVDLWGTYWIWYAKTSQGRKGPPQVDLRGMSLDGYLASVEIQQNFIRYGTDRVTIARDLLTEAQALPYTGLGIAFASGTSGVLQDLIVAATDKANYGETVRKLAEQTNGFETHMDTYLADGQRRRELRWAFPKLGDVDGRHHEFSQPGNVLEWSQESDALRGGTRWRARGDSANNDLSAASGPQFSTPVEATAHLQAGWPRIDRTLDLQGEIDPSALKSYAAYWAATAAGAVRVHTATVRLDPATSLTPHRLGDYATLRLTNQRFPRRNGVASFVRSWRVIGMEIRPPERGNGIEEANLIFEELVA